MYTYIYIYIYIYTYVYTHIHTCTCIHIPIPTPTPIPIPIHMEVAKLVTSAILPSPRLRRTLCTHSVSRAKFWPIPHGRCRFCVLVMRLVPRLNRFRGPLDKASAYGAGDCRCESCRDYLYSCAEGALCRGLSSAPSFSCQDPARLWVWSNLDLICLKGEIPQRTGNPAKRFGPTGDFSLCKMSV